jgi:hypothetical protein
MRGYPWIAQATKGLVLMPKVTLHPVLSRSHEIAKNARHSKDKKKPLFSLSGYDFCVLVWALM